VTWTLTNRNLQNKQQSKRNKAMPRYEINPTTVSATFTTLPKEHYSFSIDSVKTFYNETKNGPQYGLQYGLTVVKASDPTLNGKKVVFRGQMENEIGQGMHKRFQMAAHGYTVNAEGEKAFNEANAAADFSFVAVPHGDVSEVAVVGEFYRNLVGKKVDADLDITIQDATGREFQKWTAFSPFVG
jgi:hypothetical protein